MLGSYALECSKKDKKQMVRDKTRRPYLWTENEAVTGPHSIARANDYKQSLTPSKINFLT